MIDVLVCDRMHCSYAEMLESPAELVEDFRIVLEAELRFKDQEAKRANANRR